VRSLATHAAARFPGGVVGLADEAGSSSVQPFGRVLTDAGARPAAADDRFLLTSITKGITALQVVLLAAEGRLDLAAPIAAYVPEFAAAGKERVTAEHILSHTSGLDPAANSAESATAAVNGAEHLATVMQARLLAPPGSRFAYSSPGFWVLGELIARLTGRPYPEHLHESLLAPLGLLETRYEIGVGRPTRYALRDAPGPQSHHELARRAGYPAGGLVGGAHDLLTLGTALLRAAGGERDGPITPAIVSALATPRACGVWLEREATWGLGFELGGPGSFRSPRTLFLSGASGTAMWVDLDRRVVLVLLTASWATTRQTLAELGNLAFARR
jgi:CubicO group peptidase (beta-lactamase class C family)